MEADGVFGVFRRDYFTRNDVEEFLGTNGHDDITFDDFMRILDRADVKRQFAIFWESYRVSPNTEYTMHDFAADAFGKALSFTKNEIDLQLRDVLKDVESIQVAERLSSHLSIMSRYFRQLEWNNETT